MQVFVLSHGLKFCLTPKSNLEELNEDLKEIEIDFRLIEYLRIKQYWWLLNKNKTKFFPNQDNYSELKTFFIIL